MSKCQLKLNDKGFRPFTLSISVDNPEDAAMLYTRFSLSNSACVENFCQAYGVPDTRRPIDAWIKDMADLSNTLSYNIFDQLQKVVTETFDSLQENAT